MCDFEKRLETMRNNALVRVVLKCFRAQTSNPFSTTCPLKVLLEAMFAREMPPPRKRVEDVRGAHGSIDKQIDDT